MARHKIPAVVKRILLHRNAHFDEIFAYFLLRKFGQRKMVGVDTATLAFADANGMPEGFNPECDLCIGFGNGPFDEHYRSDYKPETSECAATLVAKYLGVENEPALWYLLQFSLQSDGSNGPKRRDEERSPDTIRIHFDLARVIKVLHRAYKDPQYVVDIALPIIESFYWEQLDFHDARKAVNKTFSTRVGKFLLVAGQHESSEFHRAAFGKRADVVVVMRSSGNVQIFTNYKSGLSAAPIAQVLREEEALNLGITDLSGEDLSQPGKAHDLRWFYHDQGESVLNGSEAADEKPTTITFDRIVELVIGAVGVAMEDGKKAIKPNEPKKAYPMRIKK